MSLRWAMALAAMAAFLGGRLCCAQDMVSPGVADRALIFLGVPDSVVSAELPVAGGAWTSLGLLDSKENDATVAAVGTSGDGEADVADGRVGSGASGAGAGLSYGGLAPAQNAATLDGLSMEQNFLARPRGFGGRAGGARGSTQGAPVSEASFGQASVRSYRVMPGTYSAEFGGAAGAVLAIASRAGTDDWHGGAYAMVRASVFDAKNPFSVVTHYRDGVVESFLVKPEDTTVRLGGHVSAPLGSVLKRVSVRGKSLAAFVSWEEVLRDDPAISSPSTASFYALTATQRALLANRGVSDGAVNAALDYLDELTGSVARFSTRGLGFLRVDEQVTPRDHLVGTYARNRFDLPAGAGFSAASDAVVNRGVASVGDSLVHVDAVAGHWLHAFTPRLVNVLRVQFVKDLEYETPRTPLAQEPGISVGGYAPEVSIEPEGFGYGTPTNLGRVAYPDEKRLQAVEQVEGVWRKHAWIAGFDWSRVDDRVLAYTNAEGRFLYDNVSAGHAGGLVDWITDFTFNVNAYPNGGCPGIHAVVHDFCFKTYTQSFGAAQTEFVTHDFAGYVTDAVRLRDDLRVMVGVRYEYVLLPLPQRPNGVLDAALQGATQVAGGTGSYPEDRNNVAPRVAAVWSPRGGNVVTARLGYGWFYGRLAGTTVRSAIADTAVGSGALQVRIRPAAEVACPQGGAVVGQGFGFPCAFVSAPPAAVAQTSSVMLFAENFRLPAVQRATLSVEKELGKHGFVRAEYAMALATQLPGSVDLNVAPSARLEEFVLQGGAGHAGLRTGETFVVPVYSARRLTQYGPVTALVSDANATYHAGTVEAELREWRGLSARGSFTFSRAIDYAPQLSGTPQTDGQFDPFNVGYDKGLSTLEFPERFAGDVVWRVREQRGPKWVREALDGWRVAAIGSAGSGAPYSYEISGGTYLSGGHETINGSGGATYLPTVGRNTLRLAARGNVDLRLERGFALRRSTAGRGLRVNGSVEAFNLLNERNLTRVETRAFLPGTAVGGVTPLVFQDAAAIAGEGLTTPAFGSATSSTSGVSKERQLEFGVRMEF